uniref:Uncharacterized protein n=1 Tax=Erpetoichthys calabaricus TaxID=27687 RepID=A0A8C4TIG6_ERPCA
MFKLFLYAFICHGTLRSEASLQECPHPTTPWAECLLRLLTAVFVFFINDTQPALNQAIGFLFASLVPSPNLERVHLNNKNCSCGNGCASWDIESKKTCHCQCANQDWTSARCCKITSTGHSRHLNI